MSYRRGDVVLVLFPNSGLETFKKRPALIVQADDLIIDHPQRVVACITSRVHRTGSTRIAVPAESDTGQQMGLVRDSLIVVDNLATVGDKAIARRLGSCPVMHEIDECLKTVLGLSATATSAQP